MNLTNFPTEQAGSPRDNKPLMHLSQLQALLCLLPAPLRRAGGRACRVAGGQTRRPLDNSHHAPTGPSAIQSGWNGAQPGLQAFGLPPQWLALLAGAALLFQPLDAGAVASINQERLVSANTIFAFKLLKQLAREHPGANIFISPYSLSTVLQTLDNGAKGRTKKEIESVLQTTALDSDALNRANRLLSQTIKPVPTNTTVLNLANAIWYRKEFTLNPEFVARNAEFFQATVEGLDFADPRSVDTVNGWAEQSTGGKIKRLMDGPFGPSDEVVLASAVYFKGAWASRFDQRNTRPGVFQLQNGQEKRVLMMTQRGRFFYRVGRGVQAVCLPYTDRNFAMSILLPARNSSVAKLLSRLDAEVWENAIWLKFRDQAIELNLPRFKLEYGVELKKPLGTLGMSLAFHPRKADFSAMAAERLFISRVSQRAVVEVDEQGSEAAAAAFDGLTQGLTPSMFVDRPFLFLIHHLPTKSILFMGIVYDPEFLGTSGELDSLRASSTPVRSRPREF